MFLYDLLSLLIGVPGAILAITLLIGLFYQLLCSWRQLTFNHLCEKRMVVQAGMIGCSRGASRRTTCEDQRCIQNGDPSHLDEPLPRSASAFVPLLWQFGNSVNVGATRGKMAILLEVSSGEI